MRHTLRGFPAITTIARSIRRSVGRRLCKHYCPVCGNGTAGFQSHGTPPRPNARCPTCGSLERHRIDWIFLQTRTNLFDGAPKRFLHVAPEKFLADRFRAIVGVDYLSADLNNTAMVKMDLTDIQYPDHSFSAIYCSHVLEHIPDDRKALTELYRVLQPESWALLQVPINAEKTYEDPAIVSPEDRTKHFGQWDHVRRCGPDYIERMRAAGFSTQVLRATDVLSLADCTHMGIQPGRYIFFCRKP